MEICSRALNVRLHRLPGRAGPCSWSILSHTFPLLLHMLCGVLVLSLQKDGIDRQIMFYHPAWCAVGVRMLP